MRKHLLTAALLTLSVGQAHAFLNSITEKSSQDGLMDMVSQGLNLQSSPISELLTSQLPVTSEQATAGGGALLAFAQSQLSSANSNELESLVPGLSQLNDASGLFSQLESIEAVRGVFEKVGLDPSMISQFAPVILGYLGDQGASDSLLGSLGGLWTDLE